MASRFFVGLFCLFFWWWCTDFHMFLCNTDKTPYKRFIILSCTQSHQDCFFWCCFINEHKCFSNAVERKSHSWTEGTESGGKLPRLSAPYKIEQWSISAHIQIGKLGGGRDICLNGQIWKLWPTAHAQHSVEKLEIETWSLPIASVMLRKQVQVNGIPKPCRKQNENQIRSFPQKEKWSRVIVKKERAGQKGCCCPLENLDLVE